MTKKELGGAGVPATVGDVVRITAPEMMMLEAIGMALIAKGALAPSDIALQLDVIEKRLTMDDAHAALADARGRLKRWAPLTVTPPVPQT